MIISPTSKKLALSGELVKYNDSDGNIAKALYRYFILQREWFIIWYGVI